MGIEGKVGRGCGACLALLAYLRPKAGIHAPADAGRHPHRLTVRSRGRLHIQKAILQVVAMPRRAMLVWLLRLLLGVTVVAIPCSSEVWLLLLLLGEVVVVAVGW